MSKVKCRECKKYVERESAIRMGLSSWCSFDCLYSQSAKKPVQKAKTNKKLASKLKPKVLDYGTIEPEIYDRVIKADGYRCRYCGGKDNLALHHIFYRSEARYFPYCSQPSNLITLCNQPCHLSVIHKNKKKYRKLCLQIVWLREIDGNKITLIKDIEDEY